MPAPGRRTVLTPVLALALASSLVLSLALLRSPASADPGPDYVVRPGANQVEVLGAGDGDSLTLTGPGGTQDGTADEQGSFLWRRLDAGSYTVTDGTDETTVDVPDYSAAPPPQSFYDDQALGSGFGYLEVRDHTTLSANVVLPGPADQGPYPTVVEYSGYDPSNPANTTMPTLYKALGYAYVGINIRGTGCSGGSFFNFEPIQSLDGYDAIEAVAAQSWVKGHTVGMVGISYPGISQLYAAQTQPPHLSAIAPMSVMDDTYRGTLYPGGILNTGFAVPWAAERASSSAPYGQQWAQDRADGGDQTCADNQDLRLQNPAPLPLIEQYPYRSTYPYDSISPASFVDRINVPVFLAGAWQDEQTGGHFPDMLADFTTDHLYATMVNGSHVESLANLNICSRYAAFLDLYVAHRVPQTSSSFVCPLVASNVTGVQGMTMPDDSLDFTGLDYDEALALFETQKPFRVLFEDGAAPGQPGGSPVSRYEKSFASWPPAATAEKWFFSRSGTLISKRSDEHRRARAFRADPSALPATTYSGSSGGIWAAHPDYDFRQIPKGTGLGWLTQPLASTEVMVGTGSVDVWIRSKASDVDLEATLTEVRPNGREVYVQSGYLRASHRALSPESTRLLPVHTHEEADATPLSPGQWTRVRVELFPFGHAFRAGSRIRITLDAPGGNRPLWAFDTTIDHGQRVQVDADSVHASRVVLPVVSGVKVPKSYPACGDLRSQPCRQYP
jgi:predicted acyl esterase